MSAVRQLAMLRAASRSEASLRPYLSETLAAVHLPLPERQRYADAADDSSACGSARSSTGPVSRLRLSAELIKPTCL